MATPLINPLRISGGTMYAFSSAMKDMQNALLDNDLIFSFSKFALLDIPDVDLVSGKGEFHNDINWRAILSNTDGSRLNNIPVSSDDSNIAIFLQNYLLNQEEIILNKRNTIGDNYNTSVLQSASERLFWKWLTKLNGIKFKPAEIGKSTVDDRYQELSGIVDYKSVVKYIGDIDFVNNNGTYSEIFLHVPSHHGTTPTVLFKTVSDENYKPSIKWLSTNNFIEGRNINSVHPAGLSLEAIYDKEDIDSYEYSTATNFGLTSFKDVSVPSGETEAILKISEMDGAVIDFETVSYEEIKEGESFNEFNGSAQSENFKFNVALIYYNLYKQSETIDGEPVNVARNLYGILVLDNFNTTTEYSELKRFDKFKSNTVTGLNGNSYSLRFNMKIDTGVGNLGLETVINDYDKVSLELFIDALEELKRASSLLLEKAAYDIKTDERLKKLENLYLNQSDLENINEKINTLKEQVQNADLAFADKRTLMRLIETNTKNINSLINGQMSDTISYNTDIIKDSFGIEIDRSVKNRLTIRNKNQKYNVNPFVRNEGTNSLSFDSDNGNRLLSEIANIIKLEQFTNYYRYDEVDRVLTTDLIINIEDFPTKWKRGQVFKLYFNKKIEFGDIINGYYSIVIRTGYPSYKTIAVINTESIFSNYPIIEIVCIDEINLEFDINLLR